jgi:threonine/homoserine/homoserine lactone efflux protein
MLIVLAGLIAGLVAVIPLGPMSMSIVGVSVAHGRRAGLSAAAGVVTGDVVATAVAASIVLLGRRLPGGVLPSIRVAALVALAAVGIVLILRADRIDAMASGVHRPGPMLFLLTAVSPLTLGAWLALLVASPFASDRSGMVLFVAGLILGSGLWHPLLALVASSAGAMVSARGITRLARLGGGCMVSLAVVFAAGYGFA